jgi:hypothetical protein
MPLTARARKVTMQRVPPVRAAGGMGFSAGFLWMAAAQSGHALRCAKLDQRGKRVARGSAA